MAKGLFVTGFSTNDVLTILAKAKNLLKEGKTVMSWSEGGTSASREMVMPITEVLEECAYALKKLDPDTYGSARRTQLTSTPPHFPL
ncbi:MAG: hypothetical protein R3Y56_10780 [Akkermansia sp.]